MLLVEVVAKINVSAIGAGYAYGGLGVRGSGTEGQESAYGLMLQDGALRIIHYSPGASTALAVSTGVSISAQTYWMRLRIQGTAIHGRVWADGTAEPDQWQVTHTGPKSLTTGHVMLLPGSLSATYRYLHVGIAELDTGSETAPVTA